MKMKVLYIAILLGLFSFNLNAQSSEEEKLEIVKKNCYNALNHDNQGVAESAIFVSIQFKNRFPNESDASFIESLEEIASEAKNPIMSYKAQLAKIYFKNTDWFETVEINSIDNEQKIYEEIAETISNKMFAADF